MRVADRIREKLLALAPDELEVTDESAQHAGHAGARPGGESHFAVRLRASSLAGLSRLARHRRVHEALGPEILGEIHALRLDLSA